MRLNCKEDIIEWGTIEKGLNLEISSTNLEKLKEQIKSSDCIYLRGGDDKPLQDKLKQIQNLKELIKDKIVVGSSAGANILSKYFYRNSKQRIEEGLGILPIKIFCHYNECKQEKLKQLKSHEEILPVYTTPETEFVIIKK